MDWLYEFPLWGFGFLIVGAFAGGSIGGLLCFWRIAHGRLRLKEETNNDVIFFCSAIGVFYSLTVSLIAVATWGKYSGVEEAVSQEAATLAVLYREVSTYPEPARGALQSQLRDYTQYVIDQAWPLQRQGVTPREGVQLVTAFQDRLASFEPPTPGLTVLHAETLRNFSHLIELRRRRLEAVEESLPNVMWAIIVIGAFLSVTATYFLIIEGFVHIVLTGFLGAFIGMVVFVIAGLNQPLRGPLSITPSAYQLILTQLMNSESR